MVATSGVDSASRGKRWICRLRVTGAGGVGRSFRLALLVALITAATAVAQPATNFILVLTDDQRWDQIAWMPTLQAELVQNGIQFTNGFVTTSLCCPSRASVLTGLYAFNHGVDRNHVSLFDDSSTLATWLDDAGYRTGYIGKYLNGYVDLSPYIPPGWDDWQVQVRPGYFNYEVNENGTIVSYGTDEADYSTDVIAAKAIEFLEATDGEPFFLVVAPYAPHQTAVAAPRHAGSLDGIEALRLPNFNEDDVSDKPGWVQALPLIPDAGGGSTVAGIDAQRRKQLESLLAVDDAIAALLATVENLGLAESTAIFYLSDNGLSQGEHRWLGKQCGYEESIRVPFLARVPGQPAGVTESRLALNIDFAPTIAEMAGVTPPHAFDGVSLMPLIDQTAQSWRSDFLTENSRQGIQPVPTFVGLRAESWSYMELEGGEIELYDLVNDPFQLDNVADDPLNADLITTLSARIQEILAGPAPLMVDTASLLDGVVDEPYSAVLQASGGAPPYTWSLVAGALPADLALDPGGEIAGTPIAEGTTAFTVAVTDDAGATASADLTLTVLGGDPLEVTGVSPSELGVGSSAQLTISGQGFVDGATLRVCPQPDRVTVDQLQWVDSRTLLADVTVAPDAPTVSCGVRVTNPGGESFILTQAVTLVSSQAPPVVTGVTPTDLPTGSVVQLALSGSGFADGATVDVCIDDRVVVDGVQFIDAGQLLVDVTVAPDAQLAPCPVRVRNPDGQSGVLPAAVRIVAG